MKSDRAIYYYSLYKTSGLFYTKGETKIELFPNGTVSITNINGKEYLYELITTFKDRNDTVLVLKNLNSGKVGEFRMKPLGKAEINFPDGKTVKLKL